MGDTLTAEISRLPACLEASSDDQLVALWLGLHRSPATKRAYQSDADALRAFIQAPLRQMRLGDVQAFAASLVGAPASQARRLSAVKSLMRFAQRIGYVVFDTAAPVPLPAIKDQLASRIVSEEDVMRLMSRERDPRHAALLRLLYSSGLRAAELCSLRWRDLSRRDTGGQFSVLGKGGRTRVVLLPEAMWARLVKLRGKAGDDAPLFPDRHGKPINVDQLAYIVRVAARRAGMPAGFSPHWFRHAHASHALDRGCPVHVLAATLGHASLVTTTRYTHAKPGDGSSRYLLGV